MKAKTSAGEIDLPIQYRDGSLLLLIYRVEASAAAKVLPDGLEPMLVFGKAVVVVASFEYRETSIGPYGELGIGVQTQKTGSSPSLVTYLRNPRLQDEQGLWVVNLPVTTEAARAGGVEIWGYPKYVTPMETVFQPGSVRFKLGNELEIQMKSGMGVSVKATPFVTFTKKDGRFQRTITELHSTMKFGGAGSVRIERLGDGPTTLTMDKLGLFGATPLAAQRTDRFQATLPAGVDAGAAEREPALAT